MKRSILINVLLLFCLGSMAQNLNGNWEGMLDVGGQKIPVIFHITAEKDSGYRASFDSPSQQAFNLAVSSVRVGSDSIVLLMPILNGRYSGKLNAAGREMNGRWYQGKMSLPLNLKQTSDQPTVKTVKRPQDPVPPFPYQSEDVLYYNADRSIRFGATFTVPLPDPNVEYFRAPVYPTVLLITGSGAQDRDENLMNHRPFAVIADYLSRRGIAVLRVDDRGMGKSTGNFSKATTADFSRDVEAGIEYLKTRKDVDSNFIGLLGHSEGGMIAPMVAGKRPDVKFIVLLAGPGVKIIDLMEDQNVNVIQAEGVPVDETEQFRPLYKKMVNAILAEKDSVKAFKQALKVFNKWKKGISDSVVKHTTNVTDLKSRDAFIRIFIEALLTNDWFNYFIKFDPAVHLARVKCPVLALNGEKDIQVSAKPNLAAIHDILKKNGNKNYTVQEMPGLNHLFQHCRKCTVSEYGELEETISTEVLQLISDWIKGSVK